MMGGNINFRGQLVEGYFTPKEWLLFIHILYWKVVGKFERSFGYVKQKLVVGLKRHRYFRIFN